MLSFLRLRLNVRLRNIFTTSLSVDAKKRLLNIEVEAQNPEIPRMLVGYLGKMSFKTIKFRCSVSIEGESLVWDDLKFSHERDEKEGCLSICIQNNNRSSNSWVGNTEIYASYKNKSWSMW